MANQPVLKYFLLALDAVVISLAFLVAASISASFSDHPRLYTAIYVLLVIVTLIIFRMNDLYKRQIVLTRYRHFVLVVKSVVLSTGIIAITVAFMKATYFDSEGKKFFLVFLGVVLVTFLLLRALPLKSILKDLARRNIYKSRLLIVGGDETGRYVAESLAGDEAQSFTIVGFLDDYRPVGAALFNEHRNLGNLDDLESIVEQTKVNEILIAIDDAPYERLIHIVDRCLRTGKVVRIYSNLLEVVANKLNVEFYSAIPVIMLSQNSGAVIYRHLKRLIDIVLSLFGLIVLSPLFVLIILGIKFSSRGPIIFTQERIGKGGVPFSFKKFRSMHVGTDEDRHKKYVKEFITATEVSEQSTDQEIEDIKVFKITDDPRIFPFGRFIRKTSLDEFPQLYNVLRGDMSLVGPRPCLRYEWDCYDEWHKSRLRILPGCTGLWQALGRSSVTFEEMVILDLYYISNMSLWLDFRIVLHTFPVIFLGRGGF